MNCGLTFIGTNHYDLHGEDRLEKLLDYLKPQVITCEFTDERKKERSLIQLKLSNALKEKGIDVPDIQKWLQMPPNSDYELNMCESYSRKYNVPLSLIDLNSPIHKKIMEGNLEKAITQITQLNKDKFHKILRLCERHKGSFIYKKMFDFNSYNKRIIINTNERLPYTIIGERDIYMKSRLDQVRKNNPNKKIIHVGGCRHVVKGRDCNKVNLISFFPSSEVYFLPIADSL